MVYCSALWNYTAGHEQIMENYFKAGRKHGCSEHLESNGSIFSENVSLYHYKMGFILDFVTFRTMGRSEDLNGDSGL